MSSAGAASACIASGGLPPTSASTRSPTWWSRKTARREKFERQKVLNGLLRACEKRPVSMSNLEELVNEAESMVVEAPERECATVALGEYLMERLRTIDQVAYVRFASVYRDFQDEEEFLKEVTALIKQKKLN